MHHAADLGVRLVGVHQNMKVLPRMYLDDFLAMVDDAVVCVAVKSLFLLDLCNTILADNTRIPECLVREMSLDSSKSRIAVDTKLKEPLHWHE